MSNVRIANTSPVLRAGLSFAALLIAVSLTPQSASGQAGFGAGFGNRVGGVSIDAAGMVSPPEKSARIPMRDALRKYHAAPAAELNQSSEMRMVSLRRLEDAVLAANKSTVEVLPDELRFLGGLTRIQYVLIYPEEHDIVLAGPGEGWKVDEEGNVVGVNSGRPMLRLEDLMIAFRTVDSARQGGISCSIDPTTEGRQRYEALMSRGPRALSVAAIKNAFGPQQITVTGVPADSHFARVLVSSDFHMKRIGMNLEPSPIKALPSYIEMLRRDTAVSNPTPRWWMACDYEPLGRSEDGLAFEIRGRGVKCMAEDDIVDAQGKVAGAEAANPTAQKWADLMNKHFDELSVKAVAFGELRNVMDMCVVAALIAKEQLLARADCRLPTLTSEGSKLSYEPLNVPKSVDTLCSSVKTSGATIVMSGGVQISSWQVASNTEVRPSTGEAHRKAKPASAASTAWWNAVR